MSTEPTLRMRRTWFRAPYNYFLPDKKATFAPEGGFFMGSQRRAMPRLPRRPTRQV